jgi:hypothetical protein
MDAAAEEILQMLHAAVAARNKQNTCMFAAVLLEASHTTGEQ